MLQLMETVVIGIDSQRGLIFSHLSLHTDFQLLILPHRAFLLLLYLSYPVQLARITHEFFLHSSSS